MVAKTGPSEEGGYVQRRWSVVHQTCAMHREEIGTVLVLSSHSKNGGVTYPCNRADLKIKLEQMVTTLFKSSTWTTAVETTSSTGGGGRSRVKDIPPTYIALARDYWHNERSTYRTSRTLNCTSHFSLPNNENQVNATPAER